MTRARWERITDRACGSDCWNRDHVLSEAFAVPTVAVVLATHTTSGLWATVTVRHMNGQRGDINVYG